ncbi:unnamed protein product [Ambrosiozyma monospora]|uniref:Unnamed protein product n=1 Tax=Ambrosiozyma monospora TaxID=43982 RepID=A0ACB5SU96_AMBMO|nr:unnamed protein product [Ambrosiozyma monospora]
MMRYFSEDPNADEFVRNSFSRKFSDFAEGAATSKNLDIEKFLLQLRQTGTTRAHPLSARVRQLAKKHVTEKQATGDAMGSATASGSAIGDVSGASTTMNGSASDLQFKVSNIKLSPRMRKRLQQKGQSQLRYSSVSSIDVESLLLKNDDGSSSRVSKLEATKNPCDQEAGFVQLQI